MNKRTLENASVLVTGGAGFIGSNLVAALLEQNNRVICLDNFSTGKEENIAGFITNPAFRLIRGDIRNTADCELAVAGVGYVFHLAALGSVPRSVNDPLSTHEVNVTGFLNMLLASRKAGIKRFIYASSSSVYGDLEELPKVEDRTGTPISPYGFSKLAGEHYAGLFSRLYGTDCIGLRYFNVFGQHQSPEGPYAAAIPRFISKLLRHEPPEVYGDGTQTRDFTYVGNVVYANQLAALAPTTKNSHRIYNIACNEQISILRLIKELKNMLGETDPFIRTIEPRFLPVRPGDIMHSLASIRKAGKELGYEPQILFTEGLARALNWYRHHLSY